MSTIPGTKALLLAASSVIVISCASSSKEIETVYVPPEQYRSMNCNALAYQLAELNTRKNTLSAQIDKKAANDKGITAVSAILFWPAAFALGGNKDQEQKYARVKGQYDAVVEVGLEKQCNLDTSPSFRIASLEAVATQYNNSSPVDYYGQAEEEIAAQTYDSNLWAQALVEVDGDESRRKAKYIELRANQLYQEKVDEVTGTDVTSASGLPRSAIELRSFLSGNTLSGKVERNMQLDFYNSTDGTMYGRTVSQYNNENIDTGTWEINSDSQYCNAWTQWRKGKKECFQVFALEGNQFRMKAIGKSNDSIFALREGDPEGLGN